MKRSRIGIAVGVALILLHAGTKLFWLLLPTGVFFPSSFSNGFGVKELRDNLVFWRDISSRTLDVPTWLLQYGFFYSACSIAVWLALAFILAMRKPYALTLLFVFAAFSVVHGLVVTAFTGMPSVTWQTVLLYVALFYIFTRPEVRSEFPRRHA